MMATRQTTVRLGTFYVEPYRYFSGRAFLMPGGIEMRLYWEVMTREYRRYMTYRAAMIAGLVTNLAFGVMRVAVLLAILGDRAQLEGFDEAGLITYVALTQAVIGYMSLFGWYDLMNSVHSGEISNDLLKPAGFLQLWFARDVGRAAVNFFFRGILFMVFFEIFYDLRYPGSALTWLVLAVTLVNGLLISFAYRFLINVTAFWTPQALGIIRFGFIISWFFTGQLMPLRLFPEWVQTIARWTPFPHILNSIAELYAGLLSQQEMLLMLLQQIGWIVILFAACQVALRAGTKRLIILGG